MRRCVELLTTGLVVCLWSAATASASPTFTEFPLPAGMTSGAVTAGPDGNLWFTDPAHNKIGRMTTAGNVVEYAVPTANSGPVEITPGPDGNLWFTESTGNKIGRITTAGVVSAEFPALTAGAGLQSIVAGPDGNLWFTEENANKLGRVTPAGTVTEYNAPAPAVGSFPTEITAGPDHRLYYIIANAAYIGLITTSGSVSDVQNPAGNNFPEGIASSPDGSGVWFVNFNNSTFGRLTTGGTFSQFTIPTPGNMQRVAAGPDGAMWATVTFGSPRIERITMAGGVTEYPVPGGAVPVSITEGPDDAMWFIDANAGFMGRISVDIPPAPGPGPAGPTGPTGPAGPPGSAGVQPTKLVVIAYRARVARRSVTIGYALTTGAVLRLSVKPPHGRAVTVVTAIRNGTTRAGTISWNRMLGGRRARRGTYVLTLTAVNGAQHDSSQIAVRLR